MFFQPDKEVKLLRISAREGLKSWFIFSSHIYIPKSITKIKSKNNFLSRKEALENLYQIVI